MIEETIALLGCRAKDKVTGFAGVITSVCFDLYGCIQVILTPPVDNKGGKIEGQWFDVNRLDVEADWVMPVPDFAGKGAVPENYNHGAAEKPLP